MKLLTPFDLTLLFGLALRRYTPHDLKVLKRDLICETLTDAMAPYTVLQFSAPGPGHGPTQVDANTIAAGRRHRNNAAFEAALHDLIVSLVELSEIQQR